MKSEFMLKWDKVILNPNEAQKITGGFVDAGECGSWTGTFSCTTTYYSDNESWTSTGLVCAATWRHATEATYVTENNMLIGTGIEIRVNCQGASH